MPQTLGIVAHAMAEGRATGLYTWGAAANGRLGNGTTTPDVTSPALIYTSEWVCISEGNNFTAGIKADGSLWTWGANAAYQLGQGDTTERTSPTRVGTDNDWKFVSCGAGYMALLKINGTIWSVGNNGTYRNGQGLASGNTTNITQIGSDTDWQSIHAGTLNLYAIKTNGDLYSCGTNGGYATAQGTNSGDTTTLTKVGSSTWSQVHTGERNATGAAVAAIGADGKAYSWGPNQTGSTAQNTTTGTTTSPTVLSGFSSDTDWTNVSANFSHGSGIKGGKLYTWGDNANYRTGRGTNTGSTNTATQNGSDTTWTGVAVIQQFAQYAINNGEIYSWGGNNNGRTGQGTTSGTTNTPTKIGSASDWLSTADQSSGGIASHGVALKT